LNHTGDASTNQKRAHITKPAVTKMHAEMSPSSHVSVEAEAA
jgi:hypothetical protein